MSAHFVHKHLHDRPTSHRRSPFHSSTTSQTHHLNRPHASGLGSIATPFEMVFLFFAILALLALVIWIAWIALSFCMKVVREKMDDMSVGKQTKKNMKRAEEAPKKALNIGLDVGRTAKQLLDKFMNSRCEQGWRGREGERRALLRENTYEERVVTGIPRGVFIHGYRYDRERYGDGRVTVRCQEV
jgi:hypothetical protein